MQEIKNFLTPDECQELIAMIDANHSRSSVVVGGTDRSDVTDHRTSSTSNLDGNSGLVWNIKNKIANLQAVHKWQSRRNVSEVVKLTKEQEKETPPVKHPLIRTHPMSNKKSIYINPNRIDHISGLNEFDGDKLLDEIYEFSFQDKYKYSHSYEKGDLVIWDNRCTMHYAIGDYMPHQRIMNRITVLSDKRA